AAAKRCQKCGTHFWRAALVIPGRHAPPRPEKAWFFGVPTRARFAPFRSLYAEYRDERRGSFYFPSRRARGRSPSACSRFLFSFLISRQKGGPRQHSPPARNPSPKECSSRWHTTPAARGASCAMRQRLSAFHSLLRSRSSRSAFSRCSL